MKQIPPIRENLGLGKKQINNIVKIVEFFNENILKNIQIIEDSNLVKDDINIKQIEFPLSENQESIDYYNLKIDIFNNNEIKDFALVIESTPFQL